MPLSPRPLHGAEHTRPPPDGGQHGFRGWSRHVGAPALARSRGSWSDPRAVGRAHPLLGIAAVAFVGYTLGRIIHRSPAPAGRSAAPRAATVAAGRPAGEPRTSIRFR